MRFRWLAISGASLALLYVFGLIVDWPGWLRGGVAWVWARQPPLYLSSRFWILAALLIAWLFLLILTVRLKREWPGWQTGLFLAAAIIMSLAAPLIIASQQRSQALSVAFLRTVDSTAGFYEEGVRLDDPKAFVQEHVSRMDGYRGVHLRTHPPGWPLSIWAASQAWQKFPGAADAVAHRLRRTNCTAYDLQGLLPAQISAATLQMSILFISALGILPLYFLARDEFSVYVARIAAVAYIVLPGLLTFQAYFSALYAVCALLALWLARKVYVDASRPAIILLALLMAALTFFAFGPLVIIGLVNAYLLLCAWLWRRSWNGLLPIVIVNAAIIMMVAVTWFAFWLFWRVSWLEMLLKGLEIHASLRGAQTLWPLLNLYDLAVFLGIPLFLFAMAAGLVAALRMNRPWSGDALILGWLSYVILLNLSGTVRAEAGRLWLFLMPVGLIVAVAFLVESLSSYRKSTPSRGSEDLNPRASAYRPALFLLVLVAFGFQGLMTGLYLTEPLPLDAAPEAVWSMPDFVEPIDYEVGDTISLRGYTVREQGNDDLLVTLYWRALDRTRADYSVFVHALGEDGEMIAQSDGLPMNGTLPTWCWVAGEVIADAHLLPGVQSTEKPIHVGVGIYDWRNGERVPAYPAVPDNVIPLW